MKIEKKYEIQKRQMAKMAAQMEHLQSELDADRENAARVQQLIAELEQIKANWQQIIAELKDKRAEYDIMLWQLRTLIRKLS